MTSEIVVFDPQAVVSLARDMQSAVILIRDKVLVPNEDYGAIIDGGKPTLLKPGAEKLASAFKLSADPQIESIVENWETGLFYYRYRCVLTHRETGQVWGSGIGSCSTHEEKYGYRWVGEDRVPAHLDKSALPTRSGSITEFEFAIQKAETGGKYGKPAEYWQAFNDAMNKGTAIRGERKTAKGMSVTWSIGGTEYRIPNINVFDTVNTVDKMAQKRALVAAVLVATNASAFFTQDIEDFDTDRGNALTGRNAPMVKPPTITVSAAPATNPNEPNWWMAIKVYLKQEHGEDIDQIENQLNAARRVLKAGHVGISSTLEEVLQAIKDEIPF
jgi:hypothetical protein